MNQTELHQFFADIASQLDLNGAHLSPGSSRPLADRREMEKFFVEVNDRVTLAETRQRRLDKRLATNFNVFDLIEPDENKLSDILASLLDPNGDHGQGDVFLRLLFERTGVGSDAKLTEGAKVQREAPTHGILKYRRRMDVLVEAGALLAIENKVDSQDQRDQVKDYLGHLLYCAEGRQISSTLIYLTPDGRQPGSLEPEMVKQYRQSGRLNCWSYQVELRAWLEACRRECEAERIRDFISDFIRYIRSALKREAAIPRD